jgi:hypothetical protein
LPPVSAARSTTTLPGFMPSTMSAVTIFGAGTARHGGGGDMHVDALQMLAQRRCCSARSSAVSSRA